MKVYSASAKVADAEAMRRLFESVPDGEEARSIVEAAPGLIHMYHRETSRDFWIGRVGKIVTCITITDVDEATAEATRARFSQLQVRQFDAETVTSLLAAITGLEPSRVEVIAPPAAKAKGRK